MKEIYTTSQWDRPSFKERYTGEKEDQAFEELEKKLEREKMTEGYDAVKRPKHYMFFDMEAIDVIEAALTEEEFKGYLKGNSLKYRLRCGKKDDAIQDLGKANEYEEMWGEMK